MKLKVVKTLLIAIFLVGCITVPFGRVFAQDEPVTVNVLYLYLPGCQECLNILQMDVPQWLNQYGDDVKFFSIDLSQPGNQQIYIALQEKYGIKDKQPPVVIIGENILSGPDNVRTGVPDAIEQALQANGANLPFNNDIQAKSNRTPFVILVVAFFAILLVFTIGWYRTNNAFKDIRKKKLVVDKENSELQNKIRGLEQTKEELGSKVSDLERKLASDPTLYALLGLANSPVDYLAEAIRIIYYNYNRPADVTVRDVNGYLISLLKMLASLTGIEIIGYYLKVEEFDSYFHASQEYIADKTPVRIIEVGWKKNDVVLKKAVVEKVATPQNVVGDKSRG